MVLVDVLQFIFIKYESDQAKHLIGVEDVI